MSFRSILAAEPAVRPAHRAPTPAPATRLARAATLRAAARSRWRTAPSPAPSRSLNLADSGVGSLRQAILDANALPGADLIGFADGLHGTIAAGPAS